MINIGKMHTSVFKLANIIFISTPAPYPRDSPNRELPTEQNITFSSVVSTEFTVQLKKSNQFSFFLKLGRHIGVFI
jgi:hypothetical protein